MLLPLFSLCWLMLFCSLLHPCIDFQNNRNGDEKSEPFFNPFPPSIHWINTLQTVCNGTNGRHATLQRSNLHPIPLFSPSRDPRSPSTDPPLNTHHPPKFFFKIFFSENFPSCKIEEYTLSHKKIFFSKKRNIQPIL